MEKMILLRANARLLSAALPVAFRKPTSHTKCHVFCDSFRTCETFHHF